LIVTLVTGVVGWTGRDALSSAVLTGDASTDELSDSSNIEHLEATGRYLVCAPHYSGSSSRTDSIQWVDLDSSSAAQVSQQASLCYLAMWSGQEVAAPPGGSPGGAQPVILAEGSPAPPSLPLISPAFVESWQANTGTLSLAGDTGTDVHAEIAKAERVALPVTLLLLLIATRNPVLAVLPLLAGAVVSIVTGGILTLLATQVTISVHVLSVVTMLSLALGIDYAILWVMRVRRRVSLDVPATGEAPGPDNATNVTILMAGAVVFGASLGLLALPLTIFRDVMMGIAIAVLVAILAAITLVPSLIQLTPGKGLDLFHRVRMPFPRVGPRKKWQRPWRLCPACLMAVPAFAILVGLGWEATSLRTSISIQASSSAETQASAPEPYDSYMQGALVEVRLSSVDVVIAGGQNDDALREFLAFIGADGDFAPAVLVDSFPVNNVYVLRAIVVRPVDSALASAAINRLRGSASDIQERNPDASMEIGGPLVSYEQVVTSIEKRQVVAGLLAVSIAGIVMTILIGTPLISLIAVGGSLLSFAAALGALVLIVQQGIGASLFGIEQAPHIESWVPIVMFCVVLGMGIDYHIFLMGGVIDAMTGGRPPRAAIVEGYRAVGPVVIVAALTMTLVFGGFIGGEMAAIQQLGIGLSFGVALDALLVRLLLVPAMTVAADRIGLRPIANDGWVSRRLPRRTGHPGH